jgi:c(7)-type cytochrome triheme protein
MHVSVLPETDARSSSFPSISRSWRERRQRVAAFLAHPPGIRPMIHARSATASRHTSLHQTRIRIGQALLALLGAGTMLGASAPVDTTRAAPAIELRLPADIVYPHAAHADSAVVFSHQTHVMLAENRCTGCHPAAFPMLKRGPIPQHGAMNAGGSCGLCHDGKQAFGVRDATACRSCHSGVQKAPVAAAGAGQSADSTAAAARVPKPHTYPASDASPGKVTFRHKTHAGDAKGCVACHPKPFRMVATPPLPDGGMHEAQACGACHDGKKTFATDDDATCAKCHRESGAQP